MRQNLFITTDDRLDQDRDDAVRAHALLAVAISIIDKIKPAPGAEIAALRDARRAAISAEMDLASFIGVRERAAAGKARRP